MAQSTRVASCSDPLAVTCDTEGPTFTAGGDADWFSQGSTCYSGTDAAERGDIGDSEESWMQTSLQGEGTVTFWWKVSSESGCDELEFYLDDVLKHSISGAVDWQQKSYAVTGAGSHTLKWRYVKDSSASDGSDCGWVDCLQWSGYIPVAVPTVWDAISYTYDPAGRRIAKAYDDTTIVKYRAACPELAEWDGDHCIAEYDSSDQLLRKFIHGPGVDQPICMIEMGESPSSSKVRAVLRLSRKPGLRLWARPPEFRRNRWSD